MSSKISDLSAAATLDGTEEIPGVQSAGNVKITPNQLKTLFGTYATYVPVFTGFSSAPVPTIARYTQIGKMVHVIVTNGNGTSDQNFFTMTLPVAANGVQHGVSVGPVFNNGSGVTTSARISTVNGSTTLNFYLNNTGAVWSTSGTKVASINFWYEAQ